MEILRQRLGESLLAAASVEIVWPRLRGKLFGSGSRKILGSGSRGNLLQSCLGKKSWAAARKVSLDSGSGGKSLRVNDNTSAGWCDEGRPV